MNETTTKYATSVQEPNHPMYHPLRVGYIEAVWIQLRDEKGNLLDKVLDERGTVTITLHFRRVRRAMGERYLVLPSNVSKTLYPDNTPNSYTVALPGPLNYTPNEWEAALTHVSYPAPHQFSDDVLKGDRRVGVAKWDRMNNQVTDVYTLTLDKTQYTTDTALMDEINAKLKTCLIHAVPGLGWAGYVDHHSNTLAFSRTDDIAGTTSLGGFVHTVPSGLYTPMEFLDTLNSLCPRQGDVQFVKFDWEVAGGVSDAMFLVMTGTAIQKTAEHPKNFADAHFGFWEVDFGRETNVLKRFEAVNQDAKKKRPHYVHWSYNPWTYDQKQGRYITRVRLPVLTHLKKWVKMDVTQHQDRQARVAMSVIPLTRFVPASGLVSVTWTMVMTKDVVDLLKVDKLFTSADPNKKTTTLLLDLTKMKMDRRETSGGHVISQRFVADSDLYHWNDTTLATPELYVYSDIVDYSIVSDTKAPLMGVVPLVGDKRDKRYLYEFKNPMYLPLRLASFSEVSMYVRDRKSSEVLGKDGLVVAVLHLRPRRNV